MPLLLYIGEEMTKKKKKWMLTKSLEFCFWVDFDFSCVSVEASTFIAFAFSDSATSHLAAEVSKSLSESSAG
jgi:hypothetical protein